MKYENLENLVDWLKANDKNYNDTDEYIKSILSEIFKQYCDTDMTNFELSQFDTTSGSTLTYSYDVDVLENDDGDCTYTFKF